MNTYQLRNSRKTILIIMLFISIVCVSITKIMASDADVLTPTDNQYLELRAVQVKEVEGKNKQVIMELWVNNIEFERI